MGKLENNARDHADRIQYYFHHAGEAGYSQAMFHHNALTEIMAKAHRANSSDVVTIRAFIETVRPLMEEMKQRDPSECTFQPGQTNRRQSRRGSGSEM